MRKSSLIILSSMLVLVNSLLLSLQQNTVSAISSRSGNNYIYLPIISKPFSCKQVTEIPQEECEALVAFYESTNGSVGSNWLTNNTPCSWYGVHCGGNGNVYYLLFSGDSFAGFLPPQIGNLSQLRTLQIVNSHLSGSLPPEIGNLEYLNGLILYDNHLSGSIPPEIGNLDNLLTLGLSGNDLTGQIPAELGNLTNLGTLQIRDNQLNGSIPPELGNLANLGSMYLSNNQFTGPLPQSFTNLNLSWFWFNDTSLCEPNNQAFQMWLSAITNLQRTNILCQ